MAGMMNRSRGGTNTNGLPAPLFAATSILRRLPNGIGEDVAGRIENTHRAISNARGKAPLTMIGDVIRSGIRRGRQ